MVEIAAPEAKPEPPKEAFRWEIVPPGIMKIELDVYRMNMAQAVGFAELFKGDIINVYQTQKAQQQAASKRLIVPGGILGQAKGILKKIIQ